LRILLDTNAFLRWRGGRPVPRQVNRALNKQNTEIYISIVTVWEVAIKHSLHVSVTDVQTSIASMLAKLLPITFEHLEMFADLPIFADHRDPFDRMLIAQAISEDLTIVSADTRFEKYKKLRVLWD
jgi:PIN domain nuclease of toxin-antitoxin system